MNVLENMLFVKKGHTIWLANVCIFGSVAISLC